MHANLRSATSNGFVLLAAENGGGGGAAWGDIAAYRRMAETVPAILFMLGGNRSLRYVSPMLADLLGLEPTAMQGFGWTARLHPDDARAAVGPWREVAGARCAFRMEMRFRDAADLYRRFLVHVVPDGGTAGPITRWIGSATDLRERDAAREEQRALLLELQHRARNIIAGVRSLVSRSAETADDLTTYSAHLSGRLDAIARTQGALIGSTGRGADLENLVQEELLAARAPPDAVEVGGPTVLLRGKQAEVFGLALHELATNAIKFGAFAGTEGRLSVHWKILEEEGTPWLHLHWTERAAGAADAPAHTGFGRQLIERGLPYDLGARTSFDLGPDGLRCRIALPLAPDGERP